LRHGRILSPLRGWDVRERVLAALPVNGGGHGGLAGELAKRFGQGMHDFFESWEVQRLSAV